MELWLDRPRRREMMESGKGVKTLTAQKGISGNKKRYESEPGLVALPYMIKYAGRMASLEYTQDSS